MMARQAEYLFTIRNLNILALYPTATESALRTRLTPSLHLVSEIWKSALEAAADGAGRDDDVLEEYRAKEIAVKRELINILSTNFPDAYVPSTTIALTSLDTTQQASEPPCLVLDTEVHENSRAYACDTLSGDSARLVGSEALCLWITTRTMIVHMGSDNALLADHNQAQNGRLIAFATNRIAAADDSDVVQTDMACLSRGIRFINADNLRIAAAVDGVSATTICHVLSYSVSRFSGHYGAAILYTWDDILTLSVTEHVLATLNIDGLG